MKNFQAISSATGRREAETWRPWEASSVSAQCRWPDSNLWDGALFPRSFQWLAPPGPLFDCIAGFTSFLFRPVSFGSDGPVRSPQTMPVLQGILLGREPRCINRNLPQYRLPFQAKGPGAGRSQGSTDMILAVHLAQGPWDGIRLSLPGSQAFSRRGVMPLGGRHHSTIRRTLLTTIC